MCQGLGPKKEMKFRKSTVPEHLEQLHLNFGSAVDRKDGEMVTVDFRNFIVFFWAETLAH